MRTICGWGKICHLKNDIDEACFLLLPNDFMGCYKHYGDIHYNSLIPIMTDQQPQRKMCKKLTTVFDVSSMFFK